MVSNDRDMLKALLQGMTDGVGLVDTSGKLVHTNRRLAEIYGLALDDIAEHPASLVRDDLLSRVANPKEVVADLQKALSDLASFPIVEFQIVWPVTRDVQLKFFPIYSESGQFVGRGTVVRDITSQKELERLKSDLTAIVSNELRRPLAAIRGCAATLLQSDWDPETLDGLVRIIGEQSSKIIEVIDRLTDVSKIQAGTLRIEPRPTDLAQLVRSAVNTIESRTRRHHLEILFPASLPLLDIDGPRIEQVMENLLENAVKYSPTGRNITVSIETDAEFVQVSIADNGIGIPEGLLDKVFDRFFRVKSQEVSHVTGAGLGLAISRSLVEAHGGRIWAESVPGGGSTFRFTLPLLPSSGPETWVPSDRMLPDQQRFISDVPRVPPATERAQRESAKARILIADDEARNVRFLRATLEAAGYHVNVVADGGVALETISAQAPDLVFLGTLLPGIDGYEVCRRVREFADVPILMLGGKGEADTVRGLDAGADDYLSKPVSTTEVLARVRANMRRARSAAVSTATATEHSSRFFACGNLKIDFVQHKVTVKGEEIKLTPKEYKILYHLAVNAGRVLVHEDLLRRVWGPEYKSELSYLWVHIRHLREKLEDNAASPKYILTQPGFGYKLASPE